MELFAKGTRKGRKANPAYFTGEVWQDPVIEAPLPARLRALVVTFQPGARTNWHTHPLGQTLHVISGEGLICRRGGTPQVIQAGDTVWFDPGEMHWHGAGPETELVHLAMQEADEDGRVADWHEPVSKEDYEA